MKASFVSLPRACMVMSLAYVLLASSSDLTEGICVCYKLHSPPCYQLTWMDILGELQFSLSTGLKLCEHRLRSFLELPFSEHLPCMYSQPDDPSGCFQFVDLSKKAAQSWSSCFPYGHITRQSCCADRPSTESPWTLLVPVSSLLGLLDGWFLLTQWELFEVLTCISLTTERLAIQMSSSMYCLSPSLAVFLLVWLFLPHL